MTCYYVCYNVRGKDHRDVPFLLHRSIFFLKQSLLFKVGRLSFRVQQIDVRVETKTLDNVFLTAVVTVQYQVLRENVYEAFYALTNPVQQIT